MVISCSILYILIEKYKHYPNIYIKLLQIILESGKIRFLMRISLLQPQLEVQTNLIKISLKVSFSP